MPKPVLTKVRESDKANITVFLTCFVTILIALWTADYWIGADELAARNGNFGSSSIPTAQPVNR